MSSEVYFRFCPVCGTAYDESLRSVRHKECGQCGYILHENQAATVGAVIRHQDKILLVRRAIDPRKGTWDIPGGFVEPDETSQQAIMREVVEETGLQPKIVRLLGTYGPTWYEYKGRGQYNTDLFFEMESDVEACTPADDVDLCRWFLPNELPVDPEEYSFPSIHTVISQFRQG